MGEILERVTRIELALSAWEADVLPLNYTRERSRQYRTHTRQVIPDPYDGFPPGFFDRADDSPDGVFYAHPGWSPTSTTGRSPPSARCTPSSG